MVENFHLDLIILADDLCQILERPYDYESLGKYKAQIIRFYKGNNIDLYSSFAEEYFLKSDLIMS